MRDEAPEVTGEKADGPYLDRRERHFEKIPREVSLANELISERREEARREQLEEE